MIKKNPLKKILICLILSCGFSKLTAQQIDFKPAAPVFAVSGNLDLQFQPKIQKVHAAEGIAFEADMSQLYGKLDFYNQKDKIDFSLNTIYAPSFYNKYNIGLNTIFHTEIKYDVYSEFDLLCGLFAKGQFTNLFGMELSVMYLRKMTRVFALEEVLPWFSSNSLAINLGFDFNPLDFLECGLKISSYNFYKFDVFFTPFWTLYSTFKIPDLFDIGCSLEFLYIDQFTLSANLNRITLSSYIKWYFK